MVATCWRRTSDRRLLLVCGASHVTPHILYVLDPSNGTVDMKHLEELASECTPCTVSQVQRGQRVAVVRYVTDGSALRLIQGARIAYRYVAHVRRDSVALARRPTMAPDEWMSIGHIVPDELVQEISNIAR